jgi:ABC-type multidrug transport system fused ATPase/permease subunit
MMAGVEVVGVGSILPFLAVAADPTSIFENRYLEWAYHATGAASTNQFLVFLGLAVVGVIVVRNGFQAITQYMRVRFTSMRTHALSTRLFAKYLRRSYVFFLDHNSAGLSRNMLAEAVRVVRGILVPVTEIFARSLVTVAVVLLLVIIDYRIATLVAAVLGGVYWAVYLFVRKELASSGARRLSANLSRFKILAEAFGGIKDVKLLGKENVFVNEYSKPSRIAARSDAYNDLVGNVPQFVLETLTFGGLVGAILFFLMTGRNLAEAIPVVGVYAMAGYRLMPAFRLLFKDITSVRFSRPALEVLYRDLMDSSKDKPRPVARARITPVRSIELRRVSFTYPNASAPVIHDQSLVIAANTTVGLVGATGGGKTTIVDIILGLLRPQRGALLVDGVEIGSTNLSDWQSSLGYVPQHIYLSDDSVTRNIAFGVPDYEVREEAVERAARMANLHEFVVTELPHGYDTMIGERGVRLSGGQRQRIGIARALYHEPSVLVLDEATSALDGITESAVIDAITALSHSKTIIMIAHRLTTVRDCDLIHVLEGGRVVASGTHKHLMESNETFRGMARQSG